MFSSASLSAVTTVVMFLLTYMPYVIVIAMEAVFGLGYKLLIVSQTNNLIIFLSLVLAKVQLKVLRRSNSVNINVELIIRLVNNLNEYVPIVENVAK